jgi:phosphatidylglycerol:prolipoprotein diacylglycerol transferase
MYPVLLRIGPLTVYSYGVMMALGFIVGDFLLARDLGRRGYNPEIASTLVLWGAIGGIGGSRLLFVLNNLPQYLADPKTIIFSGSGFVFYGGFICGALASYIVARHYKIPWLTVADAAAPALAVAQALGRVGCQLAGDGDWGVPSTLPWAMAYPNAIIGWGAETVLAIDSHGQRVSGFFPGVRVHPAPVYETLLYLGVFALLWSMRKRIKIEGRIFYLYLILAGASRFMVEFIRINPRILYGLSEAQLIAIVMVVVGFGGFLLSGAKEPVINTRHTVRAAG